MMGDTPTPPALRAADARVRWALRKSHRRYGRPMRECDGVQGLRLPEQTAGSATRRGEMGGGPPELGFFSPASPGKRG